LATEYVLLWAIAVRSMDGVGPVQLTVVLLILVEVEIEVMEIVPTQAIVVPSLVGVAQLRLIALEETPHLQVRQSVVQPL